MREVQMLHIAYVVLQEIKSINIKILYYIFKPYDSSYILYNHKKKKKEKKILFYPHYILYTSTLKPSSVYTLSLLLSMVL